MKIGYARVSTKDQSFDLQVDALLRQDGYERVYTEIDLRPLWADS